MAVSLLNQNVSFSVFLSPAGFLISRERAGSFFEQTRIRAQTHRSAVFFLLKQGFLFRQNVNHRIFAVFHYFRGVGVFHLANVSGKLDNRHLQTVAKPQIRNFIFPAEFSRFNFSFHSPASKAARHNNAAEIFKLF